ncbi:MAG: DUF3048 domain-containing protein [Chloroflexi bacterium]|nr:MAG: DUF3048 domain-containing protein [Chloroflexota bacterium]TMD83079.1 MAG: DUF3048 domain-containing protein [Chloroflexota bacterium]
MLTAGKRELAMLAMSVALVALAGCGSPGVATPTPTPSRPGPAMVQIENSILARPQAGLQQANIVYEYLAEGGISRMTVIYFQPSGSQRIEPVRSARPITIKLWHAYHGVIFFSGANAKVLQAIKEQNIPALSESTDGGAYFARDPSRRAPHNLFTDGDRLAQGLGKYAPKITYQLPSAGQPAASPAPVAANHLVFNQTPSYRVTYTYSATEGAYAYGTDVGPLVDHDTGQPIKPVNVILIQVAHHNAGFTDVLGAPAVDFDLQGTGPADVFSKGHRYSATWDLSNAELPLKIVGADGKLMHLPSGLTWIHLVDPGTPITVS